MSRRKYRTGHDKRSVAFELASFMGHGTPMPAPEETEETQAEDWQEVPPDERRQIGPLDCNQHRA